jgi:hypothetical protein
VLSRCDWLEGRSDSADCPIYVRSNAEHAASRMLRNTHGAAIASCHRMNDLFTRPKVI